MTSPLRSQAETETLAALDGIVNALGGDGSHPLTAELALVPLRIYGDALRLRLEPPNLLRAWAAQASPSLLDEILRNAVALVDRRIPPAGAKNADLDPAMATTVVARDHAESVLQAVRRTWLPRPLVQLEVHGTLVQRLGEVDRALAEVLSRAQIIHLLGVRASLGAAWTQSFPEREGVGTAEDELLAALRGAPPSPGLVARYVEGGAMRTVVERAAASHPDFAEELADTIEAMRAASQAGFVARQWARQHAHGMGATTALTFHGPKLAYAAASADNASSAVTHRLGALFGDLDVEASLTVGERDITLALHFEPGTVASIELGAARAVPLEADGSCQITVARSDARLMLRIRARSGQEISEELSFDASGS
jgi:hypothetical protein